MRSVTFTREDTRRGHLILVTPEHGLPKEGCPEKVLPVSRGRAEVLLEQEAARMLFGLLERIGSGDRIVPVSGLRSHEEQIQIWEETLQKEGEAFTSTYVARPGHSEHESGLAVDLARNRETIDFIRPEFPREGICMEFRGRASEYGFVERYPAGKEGVTGIGEEPWHFRYVEPSHGLAMEREGLILEEYVAFLREETSVKMPYLSFGPEENVCTEIFYLDLRGKEEERLPLSGRADLRVSGTNEGGIVVCRRRGSYGWE